uniref:Tubulointerstitial nephritis antigen-like n=1 Tax=Petromyzon marinus TaxID=7757 RepID=A0AAJ7U120_PETMA|nr:tubulointerstitial nephritis antigen-like [Petromyzon marinus]
MSRPLTALAALLLLLLPPTLVLGGVSARSRLSPSSGHRAKRDDALAQRLVALGEDAARGVAYCSSGRLPPSVPSLPSLGGCCPGRNDACWLPFRDSRCYCDLFCNRTVSDCCPDFWRSCLGVPPPYPTPDLGCMRGGQKFPPGSRYRDNCNLCVCEQDAWSCEQNPCLVRPELIARVNHGPYGWTASNYTSFWGMSLEDGMSTRLGTAQPDPAVLAMTSVHVPMRDGDFLPDEFDSRVRWPGLIHAPEDQGNCAASWAFSTAAVASDRLSIQTLGRVRHGLSPQQLLSCDPQGSHPGWRPAQGAAGGCRDGRLDRAWWYLRHAGVVTDECYPLGGGDQQLQCMMGSRRSGRGRREATRPCPNPSANDNRIFQCGPPYRIATDEMAIMKEIMMNGPVQALMEIHEDLFVYSRGVYSHTDAAALDPPHYRRHGMHSVRIVGWGTERTPHGNDTKYWICANSWGPWWGEEGFVRVARGRNECGVEGLVTGVWARVTPDMMATAPHAHHHHHHHHQQQQQQGDYQHGGHDQQHGHQYGH